MKIVYLRQMLGRMKEALKQLSAACRTLEDLSTVYLQDDGNMHRDEAVAFIGTAIHHVEDLRNIFYRREDAYNKAVEELEA